jgi:predicted nucleotidyltransferase
MATQDLADPAAFLFGSYRRKVLGLLLLHPGSQFHLREIARATHTQPGTVRRELSLLTQAGVLERELQGNQVRFRANATYPIYDELRSILKKTSGVADQLRSALASRAEHIDAAFIYGSVASGEERPNSDIDLMIVGSVSFEDVIRLIHPYQQELRREINPHVYTAAEFRRKARDNSSFIARILNLPKISVIGEPDELGKLGEDRKTKAT